LYVEITLKKYKTVNDKQIDRVYFLGIGGIGMSALARYYCAMGVAVSGYDRTPTALTQSLEAMGVVVCYTDDIDKLPAALLPPQATAASKTRTLIIYTPAMPKDSAQLNYFFNNGFNVIKRAAILGEITRNQRTLAIAGTHGKTTTSTLLAHICQVAGLEPTALLGGISTNYGTNLLLGNGTLFVVEADEFDRSFLCLHPTVAAITSTDPDHLDIYGNENEFARAFDQFAQQTTQTLIYKEGTSITPPADTQALSYGTATADIQYKNVRIQNHQYIFDYYSPTHHITNIHCGLPGTHNIENATAAIAIALSIGINEIDIKTAVASYTGVKRRFEYQYNTPNLLYIDDYAHHPTEIIALIASVRQLYPRHQITGIFQPHLYSRTRDFEQAFADALSMLDSVYLLDIYPARELPIPDVSSQNLLEKIKNTHKYIIQKNETAAIAQTLKQTAQHTPTVLLTIGAGDIDQCVQPILHALTHP
jgi:UDP-N-acetylmuramate--alanine ligase